MGCQGTSRKAKSIFHHGKAAAGKRGNSGETATDIFARFARREGQALVRQPFDDRRDSTSRCSRFATVWAGMRIVPSLTVA